MGDRERNKKRLLELLQAAGTGNSHCADCGAADPDWASYKLGIFICLNCSGVHRNFPDISRVKSVRLDFWDDSTVEFMTHNGNLRVKAKYEARVPAFYYIPQANDCLVLKEQWIRAKYERQEFMADGKTISPPGNREGFLWKRGRDNAQFLRRKFVLLAREGLLKYYTKEEYLGHVEVDESRGMHICEDAVKRLKATGKKAVKAVLWVSADGLRVVDEKTKDLIVDQTIEKVSFCAPDRNFDRAFSYICRDGTTRRWICHCFMAVKDTGERLSHAVGCAFAACLERKQKREKECGVTATFDASRTTFTREGSFRVTTATEQAEREEIMKQIQDAKKAETDKTAVGSSVAPGNTAPSPSSPTSPTSDATASLETNNPHAIPRRHAPIEQLARQGSFRGFPALSQKMSPFKRQLSLRINELPSTMQRKTDFPIKNAVPEVEGEAESISSLCSQITNAFSTPTEDPFSSAPMTKPVTVLAPQSPAFQANGTDSAFHVLAAKPAHTALAPVAMPVRETNPWAHAPDAANKGIAATRSGTEWSQSSGAASPGLFQAGHRRTPSEADRWLEEVSKSVRAQQPQASAASLQPVLQPPPPTAITQPAPSFQGNAFLTSQPVPVGVVPPLPPAFVPAQSYPVANGMPYPAPNVPVVGITPSQMVANVFGTAGHPQAAHSHQSPSLVKQQTFPQYETSSATASPFFKPPAQHLNGSAAFNGVDDGRLASGDKHTEVPAGACPVDPFEAQWAALESKSKQRTNPSPTNPFSSDLQKTFEIEL